MKFFVFVSGRPDGVRREAEIRAFMSVAATVENRPCSHSSIKLRCTHLVRHGQLGCAWRGGRQTHFSCEWIFSFSRLGVLMGAQGWLKCEHSSVAATVENPPCGHSLIKLRCTPMAQHGQLGCAWRGGRQTIFSKEWNLCVRAWAS